MLGKVIADPVTNIQKRKRGFTLVELLLVISIISLLSSVVLASVNSAREKAKETALISFLFEVRNAMELYKNNVGRYPYNGEIRVFNWPYQYPPIDNELGIGYDEMVLVSGDFDTQEFRSHINIDDSVQSKLPKDTAVFIAANSPVSGWREQGTIYVLCEGQEKSGPTSSFHDSYAIVVHYSSSKGPLDSLKRAVYAWDAGVDISAGDFSNLSSYFGTGEAACINS